MISRNAVYLAGTVVLIIGFSPIILIMLDKLFGFF